MTPVVRILIIGAILGAVACSLGAFLGCATATAVAKKCAPTTDEFVDVILADLQAEDWKTALELRVAQTALCVVREAVAKAIGIARTSKASHANGLMSIGPTPDDVAERGEQWLAENPVR